MASLFNDSSIHYVKFLRGSIQAWELLQRTPDKISDDTLYFIYDTAQNTKEGKLYLGQRLISGAGGSSNINISDLQDVIVNGEKLLSNRQILVYNENAKRWQNADLSDIIDTAIGEMQGATDEEDGKTGLVPVPTAGLNNRFLRVDGTWSPPPSVSFDTKIFNFNNDNQVVLQGYDLAPVGSVPIKTDVGIQWSTAVGKITRTITTSEELQQLEQSGTLDPDCIYMVARDDQDASNKYDEYMVINGKVELLGVFGNVNLKEYVPYSIYTPKIESIESILKDKIDPETSEVIPGLESRVSYIEQNYISKSKVGNLDELLLSSGNTTLVQEVNTINENVTEIANRLRWQDIEKEI